jgi:hypothetical protein
MFAASDFEQVIYEPIYKALLRKLEEYQLGSYGNFLRDFRIKLTAIVK